MTRTTPEFDQRIADWLENDPDRAPGQVAATVLAALPSIRQRRRGWFRVGGRTQSMPTSLRLVAGIAIAAVVGVVALAYLNRGPTSGVPSPAPSTQATPTATPPPLLPAGPLEPGSYRYEGNGVRVVPTVPAGWEGGPFSVAKSPARELPDGAVLLFQQPAIVYGDPCVETSGVPVGSTVDDLVAAFADMPNITTVTQIEGALGGFSGTHLEFVVDLAGIDCVMAMYSQGEFIRAAEDGQRESLWILDVDGTLLIIDAATFPETSAADRAELQTIVDTLVIEQTD